jgi:hypothetical protein
MTTRIAQFSQNLYFSFRVTDDEVMGEGDAIVVSLNVTPGASAPHRRNPTADTTAAIIRVPAATTPQPQGAGGEGSRCWSITRTRDGAYDVLLCLPRNGVPGLALEPGDSYGFDVALEDRDTDGKTVLRAWNLDPDLRAVFLGGRVTSVHTPNPPNK